MSERPLPQSGKSVVDPDQPREIIPDAETASTLVHASWLRSELGHVPTFAIPLRHVG